MVAMVSNPGAIAEEGRGNGVARAAIVAGVRTPLAKAGTAFRNVHVTDLARAAIQEVLYRANLPADRLDEVILGNVVMPVDATNPARVSALWAGVPHRVPALTVQRNCASGLEAVAEAAGRISRLRTRNRGSSNGNAHAPLVLAGGAESMSTIPLLFPNEMLTPMEKMFRAKSPWQKATAMATL